MMISRQRSSLTSLIREHNKMAVAASSVNSASSNFSSVSQSGGTNPSWSRREKLLGLNNNLDFGFESGSELLEEDVWGFVDELPATDEQLKPQPACSQSSESTTRLFTNWLSAGSGTSNWERRIPQQPIGSAPVNVPDWSRILHKKGVQKKSDLSEDSDSDQEKETPEEWIPPHTLAAQQEADRISTMVAFSVLEGAGRTLKGRDLSRVRNAIWQQTGYMAAGLV